MTASVVLLHNDDIYHNILSDGQKLSFGTHKKDDVQVPGFGHGQISLWCRPGGILMDAGKVYKVKLDPAPMDRVILLDRDTKTALFISSLAARSNQTLRLPYDGILTFGRRRENDVCIDLPFVSGRHFTLKCEAGHVRVEDTNSTNGIFLNGKRVSVAGMKSGDVLSILSVQIRLLNGELSFSNVGDRLAIRRDDSGLDDRTHMGGQTRHFLRYRRSPRIQSQLPGEDIVLAPPPAKGQKYERSRGMLSSLLGSGVMLATGVLTTAASPALLAARAASMVSPAVSAVSSGKDNKRRKRGAQRYEEARQQRYQAYIDDQKARIESVAKVQRDILTSENPSPEDCMNILYGLRRSLWERMPSDRDFLDVRLGMGYEDLCISVKSRAESNAVQIEEDEVRELSQQIIEETRIVDSVPARLRLLRYNTIGFVGNRERVLRLIKNMLVSLTVAHYAEDVRIVGIFDRQEQAVWEPMRWLPHVQGEEDGPRLLAFGQRDAHALCGALEELIKERQSSAGTNAFGEPEIPRPYYILLFGSKSLVENEPVMRSLLSGDPRMGITSLFLFDDMYQLPHDCRYIVDMDNGPSAFFREEANRRTFFTPDEYVGDGPFDLFARRQAAIRVDGFVKAAALPDGITFLQGYGVDTVEQLDAPARWQSSRAYETLAAPIGVMAGNRTFSLDIAETGHGPHGLVAGTTGSGKSELLQTWILSMALTYHPYDVEFVIIDYKGGGMANLLEPLPHVVGKITNIGTNIGRLLLSLQYEKEKRLGIFDRYGVNHIDKYQKLYRQGKAREPLPHLVIVADEFAELKKEEPDFMAELVSAARVGRSLGIHLVLATQKPAGVVDDQIQSNARFRLCLKVQDAADSRDMLSRPDAAKLTRPGRAYVRVGDDELYELFQSYWSGAPYTGKPQTDTGPGVCVVDLLGRRLLKGKERKGPAPETDQLTAVVKYIKETAEGLGIEKLQGPWLPELPERLALRSLIDGGFDGKGWKTLQPWLSVPVGMYDSPATQSQGVQLMDLSSFGHFGIYGAPGTGKTNLLKTIVLSLGLCYSPEDVNIYILDCGGWSMSVFERMPHVGGVALDQEEEKFLKLQRLITGEFESRKRIFLQNAVSSLEAYRDSGGKLPAIIIAIDNFVPVLDLYPDMESFFITLAREGATYGIYLIYTANSTIGVRYRVSQNIRGAVAFELTDRGDYAALVGRPAGGGLPGVQGRAYYKGTPPIEFQAALFAQGSSDQERTLNLRRLLEEMDAAWQGPRPRPIPVMPERVTAEFLMDSYTRREQLPLGLWPEDVSPAYLDLSDGYTMLVTGPIGCGKSAMLGRLWGMIRSKYPNTRAFAVDSSRDGLSGIEAFRRAGCKDPGALDGMLAELIEEMNVRKRAQNQAREQSPDTFDEGAFGSSLDLIVILIDDLREFVESASQTACDSMERICRLAQGLGVMVLAAGRMADMIKLNEIETLTRLIISGQRGLGIGASPAQTPFFQNSLSFAERDQAPEAGYGYLYDNGACAKLRLMD